jgi:membrane-associated phospholipid phosphatase
MRVRWMALMLGMSLFAGEGMLGAGCRAQASAQSASEATAAKGGEEVEAPDSRSDAHEPLPKMNAHSTDSNDGTVTSGESLVILFPKNLFEDQKAIWTSAAHVRWADARWLVPFAEVTGGFLATDRSTIRALPGSASTQKDFRTFSDAGVATLVGGSAGLYLWSRISHDDHKREAGILATEAVVDSLGVNTALKYSFGRERPYTDNGRGEFFAGGDSFPSDHAAAAWSAASVLAHEYPAPLTQFLVYGMATAVSASRVMGKEHFPSDVVVSSALGWLIGREVYKLHHDPEVGGGGWGSLSGDEDGEEPRDAQRMGSPSVPLDSWIYPALDRLAALGYVNTAFSGMKPWTRIECARLTEEAGAALQREDDENKSAADLQARLQAEFTYEYGLLDGARNLTANVESVYTRVVSISGPALTDGYHFGQTVAYDFGRPFERGTNGQAGGAFSASAGPLTLYVRAEYQHAPSAPAPSTAVINIIAQRDAVPAPPDVAVAEINRPELLDAYLAVKVRNWQISIGRQGLDWGPGSAGALLWNNNVQPVNMVRIVNPEPIELPGFLHYLGPARVDQFFGRLEGHTFIRRPFLLGEKISFKPIPSLELGFGRTFEIGGQGQPTIETPFTARNFLYGFFGQIPSRQTGVPGHNESEFDWTFNVPRTDNYIVFYGDMNAADDFLPFQNPPKNPYRPGIYITRFPKLPKLDFHMEAADTESPGFDNPGLTQLEGGPTNHGDLNYWNGSYRDGETYNGLLIGNTVGRDGRAIQAWLTYWISSRNTLQFDYKHSSVSTDFIPGGGLWQDYGVENEMYLRSGFYVKSEVQFEHIARYPILFPGTKNNVTAILEFGFLPRMRGRN